MRVHSARMQPNARSTSSSDLPLEPHGASVLLAEDDPPSRFFLSEALLTLGWTVHACANGADALDAARKRRFDVLLLDRNLPPPTGATILQILRNDTSAASQRACAIACSADHSKHNEDAALAAGFRAMLHKPCTIKQLQRILHHCCPAHTWPLVDDAHALAAAGSEANAAALRRLLVRELEQIESALPAWSQDISACTEGLHRLVGSARFCGAPALGAAADKLRELILDKQDHADALAQFENALRATLRHFRALS